jgi:hypothetical protein
MGNDPKIHDYSDLFACRAPPQGLRTADEAAAKLRCSIKTLRGHVRSGALRYVVTGHGIKRPHKMFTDADIDEFIANQTRKEAPASCPSLRTPARRSSGTTSRSEVIAFSARPNARPPRSGSRRTRRTRKGEAASGASASGGDVAQAR